MRYNAIAHIEPLAVVTVAPVNPTEYPLTGLTADEVAFWFYRVKSITIAGSYTDNLGNTFTLNQTGIVSGFHAGVGNALNEVDAYCAGGPTPCGFSLSSISPSFALDVGRSFYHDPLFDEVHGWQALVTLVLPGFTSIKPGSVSTVAINVVMSGTDLVAGLSYSHTITMWDGGGVAATGSITIQPTTFWPYADDAGHALYDAATGAKL